MAMHMGNVDPDDLTGRAYDPRIARRLLGTIGPYKWHAIVAALCMFAHSVSDLMIPKIFSLGVDEVAGARRLSTLNLLGIAFAVTLVVRFLVTWGQYYLTSWLGNRIVFDLRNRMFRHLQTLSMSYIDRRGVGSTMTRIQNDVSVINELFTEGVFNILANVITLAGIVVLMLATNW